MEPAAPVTVIVYVPAEVPPVPPPSPLPPPAPLDDELQPTSKSIPAVATEHIKPKPDLRGRNPKLAKVIARGNSHSADMGKSLFVRGTARAPLRLALSPVAAVVFTVRVDRAPGVIDAGLREHVGVAVPVPETLQLRLVVLEKPFSGISEMV